jgi:hypothetical protein
LENLAQSLVFQMISVLSLVYHFIFRAQASLALKENGIANVSSTELTLTNRVFLMIFFFVADVILARMQT